MDLFASLALIGLIAFLVLFLGRSLMMALQGHNPFALAKGKALVPALLELLLLPALAFWWYQTAAGLGLAWPSLLPGAMTRSLVDHPALDLAGLVLVYGGLALFAAALIHFGNSWRVGIDDKKPGALVTGGIFAISRNPIFVFMDSFFLGYALLTGSLFGGLFALGAMVLIHRQIRAEEEFLQKHYGAAYQAYRERVPRYLFVAGRPSS